MRALVTQEALLEAARRHRRPGITPHIARVLAYAELLGYPLDPQTFDHAAVVLRAERLLLDDVPLAEALRTACDEFVTFRRGGAL